MLMQTFGMIVKIDQLLEVLVTTLIFVFIGLVIFSVAYGVLTARRSTERPEARLAVSGRAAGRSATSKWSAR
jgi:hypothetical protein